MGAYKTVTAETTISDALESAASELVELKDEMETWRDGMPDSLQSTDKYQAISDACDALESADELEQHASTITDALLLLAEGREEVKPCPPHVIGTPCAACGWNGEGQRQGNPQGPSKLREENPAITLGSDLGLQSVGRPTFSAALYCFPRSGKPRERKDTFGIKVFPTEAEARAALHAAHAALLAKYPPKIVAPPARTEVTPLAPLPGAEKIAETKITYANSQQKRAGRGTSRATRLGNATSLARAGIEALREKLDGLLVKCECDNTHQQNDTVCRFCYAHGRRKWTDPEVEENPEHAELLNTITDELAEYESAVENCEGAEFPGMFG